MGMRSFLKALRLILGILMVGVGVYAVCNPGATILSLSMLLGIVMLVSGVFNISIYLKMRDWVFGGGWVLAEGLISTLVGLLMLLYRQDAAIVLPILFSMWIMFEGVTRIFNALDLKRLLASGWGVMLTVGILLVALSFLSFFNPDVAAFTISLLVGGFLITDGISSIMMWIFTRDLLD